MSLMRAMATPAPALTIIVNKLEAEPPIRSRGIVPSQVHQTFWSSIFRCSKPEVQ
jgi:hypothetical protein